MPQRKLYKTNTVNKNSRHFRSYHKSFRRYGDTRLRAYFVAGFLLVAVPASWLAANAQSVSSTLEGTPAAGQVVGDGSATLSASAAAGKQAGPAGSVSSQRAGNKPAPAADKPKAVSGGTKPGASPAAPPLTVGSSPALSGTAVSDLHENIITTIFWAGEAADANNAYISNSPSAWDEKWAEHYGGFDDPAQRNGYWPAAFTPKENPFYFALPYNDYDANGNRRPNAGQCSAVTGVSSSSTSWCKNAWIKIVKGSKVAYAQWQDVGPMLEDDADYVFGTARPRNTSLAKAGLDVSPAVRDYLNLQDVDTTSWMFVSAGAVPAGPWKTIVTTSGVYWE